MCVTNFCSHVGPDHCILFVETLKPKPRRTVTRLSVQLDLVLMGFVFLRPISISKSLTLSISYPTASRTFLPATKTKYLWHSQRGIKSLHFQDVDFIGYSILQAPEYTMDIKSTFVSPRNRTGEMEGKLCIKLNVAS